MIFTVPPFSSILIEGHVAPVFAETPESFLSCWQGRDPPPVFTSTHALELVPVKRYFPGSVILMVVLAPQSLMSMVVMSSSAKRPAIKTKENKVHVKRMPRKKELVQDY